MKTKNIYTLPIKKKSFQLAISNPNAHSNFLKHAIDFPLPENTPILATADGEIIETKTNSKEGGVDKKYIGNSHLNYITIKHKNSEYSQYAHLKFKGACVKEKQLVKAGEIIGYSGNTGFSSTPHLHFHIYKNNNSKIGWETLEIKFYRPLKIIRQESDLTKKEKEILTKMIK